MNKLICLLVLCAVLAACKKEKEYVINPPKFSNYLMLDQVINDSTLVLKWGKYTGNGFKRYILKRKGVYIKNGIIKDYEEPIDSSVDIEHLTFMEKAPFARELTYILYVSHTGNTPQDTITFLGNVFYKRPNTFLAGDVTDALIDRQKQRLFIATGGKKITILNYGGRQVASTELPATIGYCALGSYNGNDELYVPVNDGSLHILDAATLQLKDRIYIGGTTVGSVVAYNGKLYVSTSNNADTTYKYSIKVYDRAGKNIISSAGYYRNTRLLPLDGTSLEMVDLTIGFTTKSLNYHKFSADGMLISETNNNSSFNSKIDAAIMQSFPDGSKFITSYYGSIYNKSLSLLGEVGGGAYLDFAFNSDGSVIYGANSNPQRIDVIGYPALTTSRSYPTMANPVRIFRDGNSLICLSIYGQYASEYNYLFIEKINL
jgi:hypothetical protein